MRNHDLYYYYHHHYLLISDNIFGSLSYNLPDFADLYHISLDCLIVLVYLVVSWRQEGPFL